MYDLFKNFTFFVYIFSELAWNFIQIIIEKTKWQVTLQSGQILCVCVCVLLYIDVRKNNEEK